MGAGVLLFFNFVASLAIAVLSVLLVYFVVTGVPTRIDIIPILAAGTASLAVVKALISLVAWLYNT